jgi:hypothetical protein
MSQFVVDEKIPGDGFVKHPALYTLLTVGMLKQVQHDIV